MLGLACAGLLSPVWAQSGQHAPSMTPPAGRTIQVHSVHPPGVHAQRVALVIGNSAYTDGPLLNPVNDARAIAQVLKESGFSVSLRENIDQRGMQAALREFGDRLRAGGTGLFYYAGHGMQIKGRNYLIPVGAHIDREDEVAYSAVDAQAVLDKMESAGNEANIMILDACRNNPFMRNTRGSPVGLAPMDAPVGTLVAYATSPGAVASDGSGANGLYTQHLLTAIRQPGSKIEDVFKQVRANVRRDSSGKQVPWEVTSLEGDFYFIAGPVAIPLAGSNPNLEMALWDAVRSSRDPVEIRVYLNRYPEGRFATEARARLAQWSPPPAPGKASALDSAPQPPPSAVAAATGSPSPRLPEGGTAPAAAEFPNADQAAIDRRTAEILATLVSGPGPGQLVAPVPGKPARPPAASNSAGFTVGDRWRFQVVDRFKGEVVRNEVATVERVQPDGTLVLNGGRLRWDARGNPRFVRAGDRERTYSADFVYVPPHLQAGARTVLNYEIAQERAGAPAENEKAKGAMVVKGQETVRTPAGEFTAWRVEIDVLGSTLNKAGGYRWLFTGWYVPELRAYVAYDDEVRGADQAFIRRDRHELTSYAVRGAEGLLPR
jgi:hypothetical protein